jgi:hypothetical protein
MNVRYRGRELLGPSPGLTPALQARRYEKCTKSKSCPRNQHPEKENVTGARALVQPALVQRTPAKRMFAASELPSAITP